MEIIANLNTIIIYNIVEVKFMLSNEMKLKRANENLLKIDTKLNFYYMDNKYVPYLQNISLNNGDTNYSNFVVNEFTFKFAVIEKEEYLYFYVQRVDEAVFCDFRELKLCIFTLRKIRDIFEYCNKLKIKVPQYVN